MPGLFDGTPLQQPVTCEHCGEAAEACVCPRDASGAARPAGSQHPRVRREKRRGKWNTVISRVEASESPKGAKAGKPGDLTPLLKALKTRFGTGGGLGDSPEGTEIVLQGDHREGVVAYLVELGYRAKASGG